MGQICNFFMGQMLKSIRKHALAILQGLTGLYMDKKIPVKKIEASLTYASSFSSYDGLPVNSPL